MYRIKFFSSSFLKLPSFGGLNPCTSQYVVGAKECPGLSVAVSVVDGNGAGVSMVKNVDTDAGVRSTFESCSCCCCWINS